MLVTGLHVRDVEVGTGPGDPLCWLRIGIAVLILLAGILYFVGTSIIRPINALSRNLRGIREGNFDLAIAGTKRSDEIGDIARSVEAVRDMSASRALEIERAQRDMVLSAEIARKEVTASLTRDFEVRVTSVTQAVAALSEQLVAVADEASIKAKERHRKSEFLCGSQHGGA